MKMEVEEEKIKMEIQSKINWKDFEPAESRFVKLVVGKPKVLKLESVRETIETITRKDKDGNMVGEKKVPALKFNVSEEDGHPCDKEFTVTSKVLARQLKGIIEKGLPVKIKITKYGVGFDTTYEVEYLN